MIEIGLVAKEADIQVLGGPSNVLGVFAVAVLSKEIRYIVSHTDSERLVISTKTRRKYVYPLLLRAQCVSINDIAQR